MGQSYSLEEAIEGRVSSLEVSLGHPAAGEQQLNVYSFLWNPEIAGVENFIMTSRQGSASSTSSSSSVVAPPPLELLLLLRLRLLVHLQAGLPRDLHHLPGGRRLRPVQPGLAVRAEPWVPPGNASSADCGLPSVAGMLHTAGNYTWQGCQTVRGNALFHDLPLLAAAPL